MPQVEACRPYTKYSARPVSLSHIPVVVEKAVRMATHGRPGPCYIDMPGDLLSAKMSESEATIETGTTSAASRLTSPPPRCLPDPADLLRAVTLLKGANRPLVIVGKGAAYAMVRAMVTTCLQRYIVDVMFKHLIFRSLACFIYSKRVAK